MLLLQFIESLLAGGQVRVGMAVSAAGTNHIPSRDEWDDVASMLGEFELQYRDTLSGTPPTLSRPALLWGALTTFRACSFLVDRDSDADLVGQLLAEPCPEVACPVVCYSVDLTLRFLPDFIRLAKASSPTDPLVSILKTLGQVWPLSSVGVPDLGECDPAPFLNDECLRMLYVDRIISTKDQSRMKHPQTRDAVDAAVGLYRELATGL